MEGEVQVGAQLLQQLRHLHRASLCPGQDKKHPILGKNGQTTLNGPKALHTVLNWRSAISEKPSVGGAGCSDADSLRPLKQVGKDFEAIYAQGGTTGSQ